MADEQTQSKEETLEDFTTINPEDLAPELKTIYKSLQGDYTRKTQDISARKKEYDEREGAFEEKLKSFGAAEQENQQWRDWYKSVYDEDGTMKEQAQEASTQTIAQTIAQTAKDVDYMNEPGNEELKKYFTTLESSHADELKTLRDEITSLQTNVKNTTDQTSRMFNYHAQLNELDGKYKGFNKQELLDHALKTGQPDLDRAYKDLYQDDLIEAEVNSRLDAKLSEARTKGIRGPGQQVIVRTKDGTPKTFTEATENILNERSAAGL